VTADGWTSVTAVFTLKAGHGEEVTNMQRSAYSARGATGMPSGTASPSADGTTSGRAGECQV
jgi:hypothetical protein